MLLSASSVCFDCPWYSLTLPTCPLCCPMWSAQHKVYLVHTVWAVILGLCWTVLMCSVGHLGSVPCVVVIAEWLHDVLHVLMLVCPHVPFSVVGCCSWAMLAALAGWWLYGSSTGIVGLAHIASGLAMSAVMTWTCWPAIGLLCTVLCMHVVPGMQLHVHHCPCGMLKS